MVRKRKLFRRTMDLLISSIFLMSCHLCVQVSLENPNFYTKTPLKRPSLPEDDFFTERYSDGRINLRKSFDEGSGTRTAVDRKAGKPKKEDAELEFTFPIEDSTTERDSKERKQELQLENRTVDKVKQRWVAAFRRLYSWLVESAQRLKRLQEKRREDRDVLNARLKKKGRKKDGKKGGQKESSNLSDGSSNSNAHTRAEAHPMNSDLLSETTDQASVAESKLQSGENRIANERKVPSDEETQEYESAVAELLKVPPEISDAMFKFINLGFKVMQKNIPLDEALKRILPGFAWGKFVRAAVRSKVDPIINRSCEALEMERDDIPELFKKYKNFHEIILDRHQFPDFEEEVYLPLVSSIRDLVKLAITFRWGNYDEHEIVASVVEYMDSIKKLQNSSSH